MDERSKGSLPLFGSDVQRQLRSSADLVAKKRVQFLCGAGMSKALGSPLSEELAGKMVADMLGVAFSEDLKILSGRYSLEAIAGAYREKKDSPRLKELLRHEIDRGKGNKHEGHRALEYLANQGYIDKIYTTNFDQFIEEQCGERFVCVTDANPERIKTAKDTGEIPVIHLHGTLDYQCLITERETYLFDTPLARHMAADMVADWFILVGYSLSDVDLRSIFFSIREVLEKRDLAKKPYVVHPLNSKEQATQSLEKALSEAVWQTRGATYVPSRAEEFLPELVETLRNIEGDRLALALAKKFGLNPNSDDDIRQVWERARQLGLDDELGAMKALAQRHRVNSGVES